MMFFTFCSRWCGTSPLCKKEQASSTSFIQDHKYRTEMDWKRQMLMLTERQMCSVSISHSNRSTIKMAALHISATEVSQRSPHLSVTCWTLHLFRPTMPSWSSQQRSHDCLTPASPVFFFFILLPPIGSRSWSSYCLFHLPDWLLWLWLSLPPDSLPCWPAWWHLTPLPGYHDLVCRVSYVVSYLIVLIRYIYLLWHTVTSFFTFIHVPPTIPF